MKRKFFLTFFLICVFSQIFCQPLPGSYYDFLEQTKDMPVTRDKTKLIIYRPQNNGEINDVPCYFKLQNADGDDVTNSACAAKYEWISNHYDLKKSENLAQIFKKTENPVLYNYKKNYFLRGSMAMHLTLKGGKYKIAFYTPPENQYNFTYSDEGAKPFEWKSNAFEYDTENPAKVIFVVPTVNENGFYNGGWQISGTAPKKQTR